MRIDAQELDYKALNERIRASEDKEVFVDNAMGHRYIGNGISDKNIEINGTAGNGLGAYMNGGTIIARSNAQDATGDTMNKGTIYIHGSSGDATGYAMRGGAIFVKGNSGYRAGIHMKAYQDKVPALIIGGKCGSFLGEYQAGGIILVLGLGYEEMSCVGNFCATGMHGGRIFLRTRFLPDDLPAQVTAEQATAEDLLQIEPYVKQFCTKFGGDEEKLLRDFYYVLKPNTKNPYKQLYVYN
jgi:glutamate synthase domain-containing protein 3